MTTATITSKGRVTIPVDVRNHLGLVSGDRIEFSFNDETGRYEVYPATRSLASLKGIVKKPATPVSIEDMNQAIAEQAATSKADFADCLIERSAHAAECEYTVTFDVKASKAAGMQLIK